MSILRPIADFFVDIREDEEFRGMLQAAAYGFFIMLSYYILRAVRDEIAADQRGNLQIIWTVVFFVMVFVAVPAYSWLGTRHPRGVFVPRTNRFFLICLVGFWVALIALPVDARVWIDRVFYVYSSVFALFVVSVFWGLVADCFDNEQARRLFAFIAVGVSSGGMLGSIVVIQLAERVEVFTMLLIACIPLEIGTQFGKVLDRNHGTGNVMIEGEAARALKGSAWSGMQAVFASRYLTGIALFICFMTLASTVLYFAQSDLVYAAMTDRAERTAFLAKIDLTVNALTILFEVYLTARIIRWFGVGLTLAIMPVLVAIGFVVLGLFPTLATLVAIQIIYRAGRYGMTKPAREILFTVVSREEKYKSKSFIDAAVYRGGDLVSGWIYAGLAMVGFSLGAIALMAAPVAAIWAIVGLRVAAEGDERAKEIEGDAVAA